MSLVAQSLLTILRGVLTNRTWAENRILEQPIDPIDDVVGPRGRPGKAVVAVYVEKVEGEPSGLETQRGMQEMTLRVITYVPPKLEVDDNGAPLRFDHSGAGLALNLIARQVEVALHVGNETWVNLFRKFAVKIKKRNTRFLLVELEESVRIPTMEQTFEVCTVAEPEIGTPIYGAWIEFDVALRTTPPGSKMADLMKMVIENPIDLTGPEQLQATWNLSDAAFEATGLAPLATDANGEAIDGVNDIISSPDIEVTPPDLP
ncbi:hypothetical protein [Roseibium alexandrii]|uniref:hypothetical protein n=1 Tax=Roseibium alexandrii TaxID=388408 RepID=UPI0037503925